MRVAFTGKGGSGKTTISSLFARQMAADGRQVLMLDADINQHAVQALSPSLLPKSMGEHLGDIKMHLSGMNVRLSDGVMQKTTPPGTGSQLVTFTPDDWFIATYTVKTDDGIYVGGAGSIPEGNVGVKCYHGLNGAVELVLGHMIDREDDIVIVDMTAGADAFSSSLFTKVDALVIVVEPTLKSLSVYDQFKPHTDRYGIPFLVVANKVVDQGDLDFIASRVGVPIAAFGMSSYVKRRERGEDVAWSDVESESVKQLQSVYGALKKIPRDWNLLQQRSITMHERAAHGWAGEEALQQIDTDFSLEGEARRILLADNA